MNKGILSTIGHTPLVELTRIFKNRGIRFFAKMEQFNPGGSTKDRPAQNIIEQGLISGAIKPNTIVIESSSGNMGIGLAQACAYHKLRFICVVDPKITEQNLRLLKAYGAEVDIVGEPNSETSEYLPARIRRVNELLQVFTDAFWPNQYANEENSNAHMHTMHEIVAALNGKLDYIFCSVSTCGTLRGLARYKQVNQLSARIIAIDAVGSVIFGGEHAMRLIPGHGAAIVPELYQHGLADDFVHISDEQCVIGCHRLLYEEAILAGGSSGAVIAGVDSYITSVPEDSNCVAILPDRGERYLHTIYSQEWLEKQFTTIRYPPQL